MAVPVLNFQEFIRIDSDQLVTDSLRVAAVHGKRHNNLLKLIRQRIAESGEWGLLHFKQTHRADPQNGQAYEFFTMTQAGYQFLVGKMTGAKAVAHQIAFINAFEAMAAFIKNQREGLAFRAAKHELDFKSSADRGSFHGRGLHQRKKEIPVLEAEERELKALMQPGLFAPSSERMQ